MDMKIIEAMLTAAAAWLGLIDKYGLRKGLLVGAAVLAFLLIILKFRVKKDKKQEELPDAQSIGEGATTKGEIAFEDITQKGPAQSGTGGQSVGRNAKAGKKMSFKKIRQEMK